MNSSWKIVSGNLNKDDDDSQEQLTCAPVDKCSDNESGTVRIPLDFFQYFGRYPNFSDEENNSFDKTLADDLKMTSESENESNDEKATDNESRDR